MKIDSVLIPPRLRAFDAPGDPRQTFDVVLQGGTVQSIRPSAAPARGLLMSAPVDAHVHIDKSYTVEDVGAAEGNLFAAITRMAEHRATWTTASLTPRMGRAVQEAWQSGTRALRTHLDWPTPVEPASLPVFQQLRAAWRDRLTLQFVSLTPLDVFADAAASERIARDVRAAGGVLGAFIYRNAQLGEKLDRVFELAVAHSLALDFHVDEGLDADAVGLRAIAERTLAHGLQGRVTCGHACSLSVQDDAAAAETLALCAQAQLHLVALPTTNLYLQGAWDRTPVPRGITRVREAAELGLRPCLSTDNVEDAFYPFGSYDLLEAFALGVQAAHLAPVEDWLDSITLCPARALQLPWDGRLAPGCPADLLLLGARTGYEILTPRGRQRTVIRNGQLLENAA